MAMMAGAAVLVAGVALTDDTPARRIGAAGLVALVLGLAALQATEGAPVPGRFLPQTSQIAYVIEKNCVSCKLCEQVCIKDAIEVPRQHQFEDIGMSFMSYLTDEH